MVFQSISSYNKVIKRAKTKNKYHVTTLLSPFLITACGSDSTLINSSSDIKNQSANLKNIEIEISSIPYPFTENNVTKPNEGAYTIQPMGTIHTTLNDKDLVMIFPTYFYEEPLLEGYSFVINSNEILPHVKLDLSLGAARDSAQIKLADNSTALVVVDHGLETFGGYSSWPFGDVWVVSEKNDALMSDMISNVKGFYHSVSVGDLNGDTLDDILTLHMGTKEQSDFNLSAFIQQPNSTFHERNIFTEAVMAQDSGGAVKIADLDGDGKNEIIVGRYIPTNVSELVGFSILSANNNQYDTIMNFNREGSFEVLGVTTAEVIDFDLDGDLDLIFALEAHTADPVYGKNSIEIYENINGSEFERVTDKLLSNSNFSQFREFEIFDINNDGREDILLNPWSPGNNLGEYIFISQADGSFESQKDNPNLFFENGVNGYDFANFKFVDEEAYQMVTVSNEHIVSTLNITDALM